jgi:glycine hydroxymethyltransferase
MSDYLFRGSLRDLDPDVYELIQLETERQYRKLILIASESTTPLGVREALGSAFQNLYAEGYPEERSRFMPEYDILDLEMRLADYRRFGDPRYYKGVEYVDVVEALARRRCAELFANDHFSADQIYVNVQALSGAPANNAVYNALTKPGDTVMGMNLLYGGHLTHGSPANRSGKYYNIVPYTINPVTEKIDMDEVERLAKQHRPRLMIVGYSSYPWAADFKRFREIADAVGAYLLADMAHVAGLIAAGVYPSPLEYAHVTSFTTHKTLNGPRGACILTTDLDLAKQIDKAVFPGEQGGPHANVFAALAVAFKVARTPQFKALQKQTVANSIRFAAQMKAHGFKIPFGGTESHLFNVDCKSVVGPDGTPLMGDRAARILDLAGIVVNRNTIPGDTAAFVPSGLRFGTPWVTQRGFKEPEIDALAAVTAQILKACVPYKYTGRRNNLFRAKIDFDAFNDAKIKVRELAGKAGIDFEPSSHAYPHFYYPDDKLREANHPYTQIEIRGKRVRKFLYWTLTTDIFTIEHHGTLKTALYTPKGVVQGAITCIDKNVTCGHYRLTVPTDKAQHVIAWLRELSDGFVNFDPTDLFRKLPGTIVVIEAGGADKMPEVTGEVVDHTKPYFVGRSTWAVAVPPALPPFHWEPPKDPALRKTVLNATHRALGARMVPFAGWEMPVQYTGVLEEHQATRRAAGLFDVSHMGVWEVAGQGAGAFLDAVLGNEVSSLFPGQATYAHMLTPTGEVIDDCYVYYRGPGCYLMVVNASNDDKDWAWANAVQRGEVMIDASLPWVKAPGRQNVTLRDLRHPAAGADRRVDLALQGQKARDILLALGADKETARRIKLLKRNELCDAVVGGFDLVVARTGYTGEEMCFEIFIHPDQAPAFWDALLKVGAPLGLKPCGLAARDSLRTEAGLPLYSDELAGDLNLTVGDAGFESYIKPYKPWFIGRKAFIEQEKKRTSEVVRFRFNEKTGRMAHHGDPVVDEKGRVIGVVTSCSIDTEGYRSGQAYVEFKYQVEGTPILIFQSASDKPEKAKKGLQAGERVTLPEPAKVLTRFLMKKPVEQEQRGTAA